MGFTTEGTEEHRETKGCGHKAQKLYSQSKTEVTDSLSNGPAQHSTLAQGCRLGQ